MIMNAEQANHSQSLACTGEDSEAEYALLYSDPSLAIYPDLVTGPTRNEAATRDTGRRRAGSCPGLEYAIMCRLPGGTWVEVATGRTPRQVLAERWHIRIDAGGW